MSKELTPIFLLVLEAKIVPSDCLLHKNGKPHTDIELVKLLLSTIEQITKDRLDLAGQVKAIEAHLLEKYDEIYDPYSKD